MSKFKTVFKPILYITLGTLMLLSYLNLLQFKGANLAIGIVALILSIGYIALGVLSIFLVDKLPEKGRKIFDICGVATYPVFLFVIYLIGLINDADLLGPTGWIVTLVLLIGALGFAGLYITSEFVANKTLRKVVYLFGGIFCLGLLLNVLFPGGIPTVIGNIALVELIMYGTYGMIAGSSIGKPEKQEETPEEPEPEPAPVSQEPKA